MPLVKEFSEADIIDNVAGKSTSSISFGAILKRVGKMEQFLCIASKCQPLYASSARRTRDYLGKLLVEERLRDQRESVQLERSIRERHSLGTRKWGLGTEENCNSLISRGDFLFYYYTGKDYFLIHSK